jgi:arginine decarboxylase
MANRSSQRLDVWHLLDDAAQQLAAVHRAGLDTRLEEGRVRRQLDRLAAYERFWLYPGVHRLARLRDHLDDMDTGELAEQSKLTARLLDQYGERAALFDGASPLEEAGGAGVAAAVLSGAVGRRLAGHSSGRVGGVPPVPAPPGG